MKLCNAQLTEVPDAFFSLTGAMRHPLLRDAQLAEQFPNLPQLRRTTRQQPLRDAQLTET
ncbi:hypothetical protein A2U01_0112669, partial [Trifolium medium]|nr:hypothetical protein [Trifolium medium]